MGGNESHSMQVLKYFQKQWQFIQTNSHGLKIYRNRDNDIQAQAHNVAIDPKNPVMKEYDIYNYRRTQDNALVGVYAVQNMKEKAPNLCGNRQIWQVMVQSIPIRGNEINNLSFKESIYMLSQSIRGYDDCFSKVGRFHINDRMIGINKAGNVKVWLNQSFAQNHPADEKPILQITNALHLRDKSQKQEQKMFRNVMSMVQSKTRDGFPPDFKELLMNQNSFIDAYQAIEDYCRVRQIEVPDRILVDSVQSSMGFGSTFNSLGKNGHHNKGLPNFNGTVEPINDNFSFKNVETKKPQHSPPRQTLIHKLNSNPSQDQFFNNIINSNTVLRSHESNAHKSLFYDSPSRSRPHQITSIRFQQPKMSLRTGQPQPQTIYRNTSPSPHPVSPRGINFSYNNAPRFASPSLGRPNNIISRRF